MRVIEDDAASAAQYLFNRVGSLCAVVSSLPIKWFPLASQRAIIDPCFDLLGAGGEFLQVTNTFASPLVMERLGITGREISRVWLNLLPTQIWAYTRLRAG